VAERIGESICRAPFVWLAATILLFLVMISGLGPIAEEPGEGSVAFTIVGVAGSVLGLGMWLYVRAERLRRELTRPFYVQVRWVFAVVPFVFAWVAVAAGSEQWALFVGFITSVVLLVVSARWTRREGLAINA
jgi:hypothetical protein